MQSLARSVSQTMSIKSRRSREDLEFDALFDEVQRAFAPAGPRPAPASRPPPSAMPPMPAAGPSSLQGQALHRKSSAPLPRSFFAAPTPVLQRRTSYSPASALAAARDAAPAWDDARRARGRSESPAAVPAKLRTVEQQRMRAADPPADEPPRASKRSTTKYKESPDGRWLAAIFDVPSVKKDDMRVSLRDDRLTVSWSIQRVCWRSSAPAPGTGAAPVLVRQREESKHEQVIHLPEGTHSRDVNASWDGHRLILTYPNPRFYAARYAGHRECHSSSSLRKHFSRDSSSSESSHILAHAPH